MLVSLGHEETLPRFRTDRVFIRDARYRPERIGEAA